jgi:hypothetical protein
MIAITAGGMVFGPKLLAGNSGYIASKQAQVQVMGFLAAENSEAMPNLVFASLHPGMIESDIFYKSGAKPEMLPMDTGKGSIYITILAIRYNKKLKSAD